MKNFLVTRVGVKLDIKNKYDNYFTLTTTTSTETSLFTIIIPAETKEEAVGIFMSLYKKRIQERIEEGFKFGEPSVEETEKITVKLEK